MSATELDAALAELVLGIPLQVVAPTPRLSVRRVLARTASSLTGESWRTPLARSYGLHCERSGTPGDCLGLFEDGPGLDGGDKRDLALALSVGTALESLDAEVRATFSATRLSLVVGITLAGYLALLVAPEPISKGVASALALLMWGYLGWEFLDLIQAYLQLWEESAEASTFEELRTAGDRFGRVIGPNSMRILLLLGTAAIGETAALVSKAPTLPGFGTAAARLESQTGISDVLVAIQEADTVQIAVAEGTFSAVLPANAMAMVLRGSSSSPRLQVHHIATVENETSTARGGPWTPAFRKMFDKAGMSMDDPANKVKLSGHYGPHPRRYHEIVFKLLEEKTYKCASQQACALALRQGLRELAEEISTQGSRLYDLLTRGARP
ncbi:AHH domain-containing protein [Archangium primigenium]|uniref:SitA5 family polymorphic toxin n=1 Tax=[Archangium] primigenium TaxID=2792470 RepID=UPI00195BB5DF